MKNITVKLVCIIASILVLGFCCFALIYWLPKDNNSAKFEIDTTEVKKSYMQGEEFSSQGLKAFIDEKELSLKLVQIDSSKFDSSKSGQYQISITYEGQVKQYSVHVYSEQEILDAFKSCPSQVGDQLQLNFFIAGEENGKVIFDGKNYYSRSMGDQSQAVGLTGKAGQEWYKEGLFYTQAEDSQLAMKEEATFEQLLAMFNFSEYDQTHSLASNYLSNLISLFKDSSLQVGLEGDNFKITVLGEASNIEMYMQGGSLIKVKVITEQSDRTTEISYAIEQIPALPQSFTQQEILDAFNSCAAQVGDQLQLNLFIAGEENVKQIFDGETAYGLTKDYNGIEIMGAPGQTWYKKGIHYSQKEGLEQVVKQEIPIETLFPYYDKDGQSSLASSYIANMISIYKSASMQAGLEGDSFKITTSLNGEEVVIYLQDGKLTKIVGQVKAGENSYPLVVEFSYTIEQIPALPDEIIAQI